MNAPLSPHLRGMTSTRFLKVRAAANDDLIAAIALASSQNWKNTPDVIPALKAAMGVLNTTDEAALLGAVGYDFAEFLRGQTVLGKLLGLQRVPFRTRLLAQSSGTSAHFVGEANPKPVSRADFTGENLPLAKVVAIAVITMELARSSSPSAETAISRDLTRAGAEALDLAFLDPANSGSVAKPASVTYGAPQFVSGGGTVGNIDEDFGFLINSLVDAGSDLAFAAWVMLPRTAVHLSRQRGIGDGPPAYPGMTARGGSLMGLPVITTPNIPISNDTGNTSSIVLLDASQIALADDGDSALSVATDAAIQMETAPNSGASELVSLWQLNLAALRAERMVNWRRRHPGVVATLTDVTY